MVPGCWQFASVLVLTLFVSTSVVLTDTPACNSSDQHCLIPPKTDALIQQQKDLDKERQNSRELNRQDRTERDIDRNWDHHQNKFLGHANRESRRLYDRIRDVKKSALDRRNHENIRDSRRLRGNRRYLAGERLSDLHSSEIESSEHDVERPDTLRDRLLHRFALSASENGYLTARAQRRFARFYDDVEKARITTRFERLQKDRMERLNRQTGGEDGVKVTTRFERSRNDRMARLSKSDANLRTTSENDHLLPRHFQNSKRLQESIGRRESGFERRNAYATIIRNQVRVSDDTVKPEQIEPRFEVQRKHRQELEAELKKENIEGVKDEEQEAYMENRRMRKEQRREMEEQMIREEKQRMLEEEKRIREEAERVRAREQKIRETERRIQEIIRQIREKERRAREEKQRKLNDEKHTRQSVTTQSSPEKEDEKWLEERERFNIYDNNQRIHYDSVERTKNYDEGNDSQDERQEYDGISDISDEDDWDYSDYSNSNSAEDSYEDEWEIQRRIREDIRHFPDIERQVRENVQTYGREYLDAREIFSDEVDDNSRRNTEYRANREEHKFRDERREEKENNNERRKRSLDEKNRSIHTDRRFRHSSELDANKENRQIAENRSFRSQDERLIRRVNLRRMDAMRRLNDKSDRIDLALQRRQDNQRTKHSRNRRIKLNRNRERTMERRGDRLDELRREDNRRTELERIERINLTLQERKDSRQIRDSLSRNHRSDLMRTENRRRENSLRLESMRNERRSKRADITLERRESNRRIEDSRDRRIESVRNVEQRSDRVDETSERLENNRRLSDDRSDIVLQRRNDQRLEESRDRRIESRRNERRSEETEVTLQKREDSRRVEDSRDRRGETDVERRSNRNEIISQRQETDRRFEDHRDHRIESERNDNERRNNRVEMTLERREDNRRIEYSRDRRTIREISEENNERRSNQIQDTLRLSRRRIDELSRRQEGERGQQIRDVRVDSRDRRSEREESSTRDELVSETSTTERRQLDDEIFSKSPIDKLFTIPKQNQYVTLRATSATQLLQAALIGVIVLKVIMSQEFSEKKFRTNCYFKNFGSIFNILKVF